MTYNRWDLLHGSTRDLCVYVPDWGDGVSASCTAKIVVRQGRQWVTA